MTKRSFELHALLREEWLPAHAGPDHLIPGLTRGRSRSTLLSLSRAFGPQLTVLALLRILLVCRAVLCMPKFQACHSI